MIENLKKIKIDNPVLYEELISRDIYERYYEVHDGDVVMDMGANVGAFTMKIIDKCKICYCIEPGNMEFQELKTNLKDYTNKVIFSNEAISVRDEIIVSDKYNIIKVSYRDYIKKHKIKNINFMKIDAEGAEWDVFIKNNVDLLGDIEYISGEFHIRMNGTGVEYKDDEVNETLDILEKYFYVKYTGVGGEIIDRINIFGYNQFLIYAINKSNNNLKEWNEKNKKSFIEIRYMDGNANVSIFNNDVDYNVVFINNNEVVYSSVVRNGWAMTDEIKDEWLVNIYENDNKIIEETITKDNNFVLKTT